MNFSPRSSRVSTLPQHRGFAIVTAITLLAMVTLCMVVLTVAFEHEIARTRQTQHRLQLQLLASAGAVAVQQRLDATGTSARWQLALPEAVTHHGGLVELRLAVKNAGHAVATIFATYAGLDAGQTITYVGQGGHWQIQSLTPRGDLHHPGGAVVGEDRGPKFFRQGLP